MLFFRFPDYRKTFSLAGKLHTHLHHRMPRIGDRASLFILKFAGNKCNRIFIGSQKLKFVSGGKLVALGHDSMPLIVAGLHDRGNVVC